MWKHGAVCTAEILEDTVKLATPQTIIKKCDRDNEKYNPTGKQEKFISGVTWTKVTWRKILGCNIEANLREVSFLKEKL